MDVLASVNPGELAVFVGVFAIITVVGLFASRWRQGNLSEISEWGLAGRRFGGFVTWFLQGGSIYTTYSFIAVPALVFSKGAIGFYALPYLVLAYFVLYLVFPHIWSKAKERGYVTAADLVQDHFSSRLLSIAIALTGIVAMVPYVALQIYGIEICLSEIGLPAEGSLIVATSVLAAVTFVSGLRAAALIAIVKDVLIWTTVLVAVFYFPLRLGGIGHIFRLVPADKTVLPASQFSVFGSLAVGSALALYLYPHTFTGSLSASNARISRVNAFTLPLYTVMLGLLALLGYFAIAAGVHPSSTFGANAVVPELFQKLFPPWFAGFGLVSIAIGALVPASVMSIAVGNLFARNVFGELANWRQEIKYRRTHGAEISGTPDRDARRHQTTVAKYASLVLKFFAVGFILAVPSTLVINFQLAGGVWILQTLPAVFLAPFVGWLDRRAVLAGWAVGMAWGTWLLFDTHFASSTTSFGFGGRVADLYIGIPTVVANMAVVGLGGAIAKRKKVARVMPPNGASAMSPNS